MTVSVAVRHWGRRIRFWLFGWHIPISIRCLLLLRDRMCCGRILSIAISFGKRERMRWKLNINNWNIVIYRMMRTDFRIPINPKQTYLTICWIWERNLKSVAVWIMKRLLATLSVNWNCDFTAEKLSRLSRPWQARLSCFELCFQSPSLWKSGLCA